ncbi:MAG: DUF3881 family protein [Lachnospiraceae bacterium]|nr:DUF3881 family protein [Lachnospiraceae bacterium]
MHSFLRSIGFDSVKNRDQEKALVDWVLENPSRMSVVSLDRETNLAIAEKDVNGHAGIAVVGEIGEQGGLVPEYYFPYLGSTHISSTAPLSYEKTATRDGFSGMCEDDRLGLALIFDVKNVTDVVRDQQDLPLGSASFQRVMLSALLREGTVLLPIGDRKKAPANSRRNFEKKLNEAEEQGDLEAVGRLAREEMLRFGRAVQRIRETDVLTVVESFFMPCGMESYNYYFLGEILSSALILNEITKERYYRMIISVNGVEFTAAIHENDLQGVPSAGMRLRAKGMLMGELAH